MIMTRRAANASPPPLLFWRERSEIERLEADCLALIARIEKLRPHAHYRVELEARLRDLRARQMALECALRRRQDGERPS